MFSVTTALPSSSSTSAMSPTLTPETFTAWPCPGSTPWAVSSSTSSLKSDSPITGIHAGQFSRWWARM
jgi:hypothetical protein